ncbi:TPR_REGION domain-containing protein [Haematococcus lacustris]|uniref:TPR_REGION domain-containing protein n=1 Tax=Haematococcus lacustris TaxID=44745 RepID=A0A6A0A996_HAELA|nr:TPR_REGION domain-containing protein [Haematococcus lacustris]
MPALTPELAKAAADMMSKMSPEDMQSMAAMMGAGPSGSAPGRLPGLSASGQLPGDMMSKMNDPGMMEAALKMMKGMDKASMASMMQASGLVKSQAQAEAMVDQMQGMSDTQLKMMVKAATVVQSGARVVSRAKEFLYSRPLLVAALLVLLLAVLLRWLGVM